MNGLSGKAVIVTGGGSGIGRAAVQLLAEAGCNVMIADLNETGARAAISDIEAAGKGSGQFIRTDVSNEADVRAMVEATLNAYGRLDGAINSAGVPSCGKLLAEVSLEEFDRCNNINLRGMFLCLKYQIEAMEKTGGGSIVAISSSAAITGVPRHSEYCASKSGVTGLVRGAAVDYADKGIRFNAILPGGTWTPMVQFSIEQDPSLSKVVDLFPMKRFAQPHEVAGAAVWLISDEASYVTGASWPVDGALTVI
jgi:2,5-dichloro-2,5-cyclohexadiene-1,4-diol dehydrogenase 1